MDPFSDGASMRVIQLIGGVNVVQREGRKNQEIKDKKKNGKRQRPVPEFGS
jgi:hypothetical protein